MNLYNTFSSLLLSNPEENQEFTQSYATEFKDGQIYKSIKYKNDSNDSQNFGTTPTIVPFVKIEWEFSIIYYLLVITCYYRTTKIN